MEKNYMNVEATAVMGLLVEDNMVLHTMLKDLIKMYQLESQLKRHHKAYLHVREQADEMCEVFSCTMDAMNRRMEPAVITAMMTQASATINTAADPCENCTTCCGACMEENGQEEAVVMPVSSFETMQDDMICMGEGIDLLITAIQSLLSGQSIPKTSLEKICEAVSEMADDVCDRWSDMEV